MDAVHGAHIHTSFVLDIDAWLCNDVGQSTNLLIKITRRPLVKAPSESPDWSNPPDGRDLWRVSNPSYHFNRVKGKADFRFLEAMNGQKSGGGDSKMAMIALDN
jgi:hypothetical protein